MTFRATFACTGLTAALLACGALPAAAEDFYAGKQVTFIVGSGVGGGYDLLARLAARHLGKHIPGNPVFVVQNMPAAGSLVATNLIATTAPKDGTTIALVQRGMLLSKLTAPSTARFDIDKLSWIGSLQNETSAVVAWHAAPQKTAKDLFEREMIVGATAGADPETTPRLYNSILGTKFKIITGYESTSKIALAMERGEVDGIGDWSLTSMKSTRPSWMRDKLAIPLMQSGLTKNPELGDIPASLDFVKNDADRKVLELFFTQKTAARPVIAPPGIPADRLAILRKAFMALATDADFLGEAQKTNLDVSPISGEEVDKIVALIGAAPKEVTDRFAKIFAESQ